MYVLTAAEQEVVISTLQTKQNADYDFHRVSSIVTVTNRFRNGARCYH
jgi:hypothetical protein